MIQSCCASSRRLRKCPERLYAKSLRNVATKTKSQPSFESPLKTDNNLHLVDFSNQNLGALPEYINNNPDFIEHLILDGNQLTEQALEEFPRLENLQTLSLNSNKVKNIGVCFQLLRRKCPNLRFLSLIGNPGWPHPIRNRDHKLYVSYTRAALKFLPSLRFIDTVSLSTNTSRASLSSLSSSSSSNDSSSNDSGCRMGVISSSHRSTAIAFKSNHQID